MKKTAIFMGIAALSLVGTGFGAATVLAPPLPEIAAPSDAAGDQIDTAENGDTDAAHLADKAAQAEPKDSYEVAKDRLLVRIGQINVPVPKTRSISYVVADIALKAHDASGADKLTRVEAAVRARDVLLQRMHALAERPILRGVSIDSEALGLDLTEALQDDFPHVAGIVFVNLVKQDVPRL